MRELIDQYEAGTKGDLYALYLDFMAATHSEVVARTAPGAFRERLLRTYRPLPREHFEARMESLGADAPAYEEAVASLRRGFVPRCGQFHNE